MFQLFKWMHTWISNGSVEMLLWRDKDCIRYYDSLTLCSLCLMKECINMWSNDGHG